MKIDAWQRKFAFDTLNPAQGGDSTSPRLMRQQHREERKALEADLSASAPFALIHNTVDDGWIAADAASLEDVRGKFPRNFAVEDLRAVGNVDQTLFALVSTLTSLDSVVPTAPLKPVKRRLSRDPSIDIGTATSRKKGSSCSPPSEAVHRNHHGDDDDDDDDDTTRAPDFCVGPTVSEVEAEVLALSGEEQRWKFVTACTAREASTFFSGPVRVSDTPSLPAHSVLVVVDANHRAFTMRAGGKSLLMIVDSGCTCHIFCGPRECMENYTTTRTRVAMASPQSGGFFAIGVGELPVIALDHDENEVKLKLTKVLHAPSSSVSLFSVPAFLRVVGGESGVMFLEDEAHLEVGELRLVAKREDNLYVLEVDLQHPAADEFTAVAVAESLRTQDPNGDCARDVETAAIALHLIPELDDLDISLSNFSLSVRAGFSATTSFFAGGDFLFFDNNVSDTFSLFEDGGEAHS